ncbi:SDR family oxidoreductase [Echinicola shivajiensis]|uniref:SDR family oxidoreductase n=1 Tax=Echinicola shivajiensis TaxID=1035916 RepID=UPI001BFC25D1|nr:SDR family oxidoreductase [Echinicola shivajiensis]
MSKILITGATGGLGSAVAYYLKDKSPEQSIAVLVRDGKSEKALKFKEEGFDIRVADYNDPSALSEAFAGIDILYFVSGSDMTKRDVQHKNVVGAAKSAGIAHILYTSVSLNNLSTEAPLYGAMKIHLDTEAWIKETGLKYTFLRHNLYSEIIPMFLGAKEQLLASKMVYLPTGEGKTAFVPRSELAEIGANVLADAAAHENKIYELNGTEKVTFAQVAKYLSEILGETISYVSPEVEEFERNMEANGVPAEYIGMMTIFGLGIAEGVFDAPDSDLEKLLGRSSLAIVEFLSQVYK